MIDKIVFFNHYHRGDIFTHRGFIQDLKNKLLHTKFEYLHYNHPKLTRDLEIPLVGDPSRFSRPKKEKFFLEDRTLYINTWIGSYKKFMKHHGGLNMSALYDQWLVIYNKINEHSDIKVKLGREKENYLPDIDYGFYDLSRIDDYVKKNPNKKVLLCNGSPKSNQSFSDNMKSFVEEAANKFSNVHFICTEKFQTSFENILFTDDIIQTSDIEEKRAPWEDRSVNICDLFEISYLSRNCNLIVGKNSGPFCFCETKSNYLDKEKNFLSYNVSWGMGNLESESMSFDLQLKCNYQRVQIEQVDVLSKNDKKSITDSLTIAVTNIIG